MHNCTHLQHSLMQNQTTLIMPAKLSSKEQLQVAFWLTMDKLPCAFCLRATWNKQALYKCTNAQLHNCTVAQLHAFAAWFDANQTTPRMSAKMSSKEQLQVAFWLTMNCVCNLRALKMKRNGKQWCTVVLNARCILEMKLQQSCNPAMTHVKKKHKEFSFRLLAFCHCEKSNCTEDWLMKTNHINTRFAVFAINCK